MDSKGGKKLDMKKTRTREREIKTEEEERGGKGEGGQKRGRKDKGTGWELLKRGRTINTWFL